MTKLMNILPMILSGSGSGSSSSSTGSDPIDWAGKVFSALEKFLVPFLIILCGVGLIWAVVVGVQMIKADTKDKMEDNKKRLINIGITIVAVIALIAVFYALKAWLAPESGKGLTDDAKNWFSTIGYMIKK